MDYKQLKVVDFSQGIKSSEVMNNDLSLQEQIERERLSIAGSGVNFGLDLELLETFNLEVSKGTVIDIDGKEVFVDTETFEIEKPRLITRMQRVHADAEGRITLNEVPYSSNRTMPSEYTNDDEWGIDIYYDDNSSSKIYISSIDEKILYTDIKDPEKAVIVTYNAAHDRIDTVYLNENYEIGIKSGIDSTAPSAYIPEDCKYILGFVKVISKSYIEDKNTVMAKTFVLKEFNNRRTVYTDLENNLYLCGVPFESLLKIYFDEPKEPKEGMLWYDMKTNKLKIWRRTDNFIFTDKYKYLSSNPDNPQLFNTSVGYKRDSQLSVYKMRLETVYGEVKTVWHKFTEKEIEFFTDIEEENIGEDESFEFRIVPRLLKGDTVKYAINRYDDSHYWVPINDTAQMPVNEYKMWCPSEDGNSLLVYEAGLRPDEMKPERLYHDLKHFIFDSKEIHLRFNPYKNELNLMIDQIPLHKDQFVEITVNDVLNSSELSEIAIVNYGYTMQMLEAMKDEVEDIGIGFKFVNQLDKPAFIEVNIEHRANVTTPNNKMQRTATFNKSGTIIYDISSEGNTFKKNADFLESRRTVIFPVSATYRYGEEQLEVYLNGRRLGKESVIEITTNDGLIGSICKSFAIPESMLVQGDEIIYKVTTNVYSYDHVVSAITEHNAELEDKVRLLEDKVKELSDKIEEILENQI